MKPNLIVRAVDWPREKEVSGDLATEFLSRDASFVLDLCLIFHSYNKIIPSASNLLLTTMEGADGGILQIWPPSYPSRYFVPLKV